MDPGFVNFLIASVVMELTPGPNMTWLALLAAREGRGAGLRAVAGISLGLALLGAVAATGAAALISSYPVVFDLIRWAGVAFLLYLAAEAWIGERSQDQDDQGRHFRRGLLVNLLNPKAATVFVVLVPSFSGGSAAHPGTIALMSIIYVAIATLAHAAIALFASSLQGYLTRPEVEKPVRRIFAIALAAVAVWFAFAG
jgi:threonine/homoserine/homoserine lactone efflux protein